MFILLKWNLYNMNWYKLAQYELPDNFNVSKLGNCMLAARLITENLLLKGISDFYIIEGWISFPGYEENSTSPHTWIESNNKIIDPSKKQFEIWGFDSNDISYDKIKKKYTPKEYLELCKKYPD